MNKAFWFAAAFCGIALVASDAFAQRDRNRDDPPGASRDRDRDGDRDRDDDRSRDRDDRRELPRDRGDAEGTEEGLPRAELAPDARIRPMPQGWRLGVWAVNTNTGVRITRVGPNTPAWRAGLEPGDAIVTVDGYQVGHVGGRTYYLGEELRRRAGPRGEVRLLVQNVRTNQLMNVDVTLTRGEPVPVPMPWPRGRLEPQSPRGLESGESR